MTDIFLDADVSAAATLPGSAYCSEDTFAREQSALFPHAWLGLPPLSLSDESAAPVEVLPGVLSEPLCLTRNAAGEERLVSNVCTHRGMLVVTEAGPAKRLRCTYHGRRFALCGRLEAAPGFEGAKDFPTPRDDLPQVALQHWGPLRFVALEPSQPFDTWLEPFQPWFDGLPLGDLEPMPSHSKTYDVAANWKLYLDNYLEGFHIPTVHKSLAAALDVGGYEARCVGHGSVQVGRVSAGEATLPLGPAHPLFGEDIGALYLHLFPTTLLNIYPWGISVNHIRPVAAARTRVTFESYVWDRSQINVGAGADLDRVEQEDEAVVEGVQRGLRSRLYDRGRYAPSHEQAVHHFHREWLARVQEREEAGP